MREFTNEDIKSISLEILQFVHQFCEKNKLKYSLFYGTLLGAVRHQGFIPWDDDIDVAMPREDYEKFLSNFNEASDQYSVVTCWNDSLYVLPFAKVVKKGTIKKEYCCEKYRHDIPFGIDLFPVDYVDNYKKYKSNSKSVKKLIRKRVFAINDSSLFNSIIKKIVYFFANLLFAGKGNYYARKLDSFYSDVKFKNYMLTNDIFVFKRDHFYDGDIFNNLALTKFENYNFYIVNKYDNVLKACYGDYKKLPPEENRITHHNYRAYFLEDDHE